MINKELSEILDALTRETGDTMPPCQELEMLGFDPFGRLHCIKGATIFAGHDNDEESRHNGHSSDDDGYTDEEYEFDEEDERYRLLVQVLRLSNCRKKYFA
jgi:hypothetical protein